MKSASNRVQEKHKNNKHRIYSLVNQNPVFHYLADLLNFTHLSHDPVDEVADQMDMFFLLFVPSQHLP